MRFVLPNKYYNFTKTKITNTTTMKIKGIEPIINHTTFFVVKSADLLVTDATTKPIGYVGENLIYVIKVVNKGPSKATGVILTDILPSNSICKSIYLTQGNYKHSKNEITCYLGDLSCSEDAIAIITVIPRSHCILTNRTFITANEYDADLINNFSKLETKIFCHPTKNNLSISLFSIILLLLVILNINCSLEF